jgi:hypothetical protein
VLSPGGVVTSFNRVSPSLTTLKISCLSLDNIGLIDGTTKLTMEVRCDDRTQQDLIGMLINPTFCGLWITWNGLRCEGWNWSCSPRVDHATYCSDSWRLCCGWSALCIWHLCGWTGGIPS